MADTSTPSPIVDPVNASNTTNATVFTVEEQVIAYSSLYGMAMMCIIIGGIRSLHFVARQVKEKKLIESSITMREAKKFPFTASIVLFGLYLFFKFGDNYKTHLQQHVAPLLPPALAAWLPKNETIAGANLTDTAIATNATIIQKAISFLPRMSKENIMFFLLLMLCWEGSVAIAHLLKPLFSAVLKRLPIAETKQPRLNLPYVLAFTRGKRPLKDNEGTAEATKDADELFKMEFDSHDVIAVCVCLSVGISHLYRRHWITNNLLGIAFSIYGIENLHLASFKAGTLLLAGLFIYDVFWVFATDVMTTVAKGIDAPILLQFPQDILRVGWLNANKNAMLGLGDIVIPGIFIALLRRFDRHLADSSLKKGGARRARYYFWVTVIAYALGLVVTMGVMHYFKAAQPALLYLVPACVLVPLGLAKIRGEFGELWNYSEEHLADTKENKAKIDEKKKKH